MNIFLSNSSLIYPPQPLVLRAELGVCLKQVRKLLAQAANELGRVLL